MVFFTCNNCGESVKKPAVEKHYNTKCRGAAKSVSCMDCLKDFYGEEYVAHTKCISEMQKYSGKDYVHKEAKNSGAKKQESWMDIIRAILDSSDYKLSAQARSAFQRLQSVDNVPRKKAKFQNFVKNCMHMPMRLAEEVWGVLEKEQEKMRLAKQQNSEVVANGKEDQKRNHNQNGVEREATAENSYGEPVKKKTKKERVHQNGSQPETEAVIMEIVEEATTKSKKKKKNAHSEVETVVETNGIDEIANLKKSKKNETGKEVELSANDTALVVNVESEENFAWNAVIEKIVLKSTEGIALEKLKKRVLKKYAAKLGDEPLTEKQQKKFEKKFAKNLKKSASLQVDGEIVRSC